MKTTHHIVPTLKHTEPLLRSINSLHAYAVQANTCLWPSLPSLTSLHGYASALTNGTEEVNRCIEELFRYLNSLTKGIEQVNRYVKHLFRGIKALQIFVKVCLAWLFLLLWPFYLFSDNSPPAGKEQLCAQPPISGIANGFLNRGA